MGYRGGGWIELFLTGFNEVPGSSKIVGFVASLNISYLTRNLYCRINLIIYI
jgi:hypothetical protein